MPIQYKPRKKKKSRAGELIQRFWAFVVLAEDRDLIPSIHMASRTCLQLKSQGTQHPHLTSNGTRHTCGICTRVHTHNIVKYINKSKIRCLNPFLKSENKSTKHTFPLITILYVKYTCFSPSRVSLCTSGCPELCRAGLVSNSGICLPLPVKLFAWMYVCTPHGCSACRGQDRALDPLSLWSYGQLCTV